MKNTKNQDTRQRMENAVTASVQLEELTCIHTT